MSFLNREKNSLISLEQFSSKKVHEILGEEQIAILGYGAQGSAQALNLRDTGISAIIGEHEKTPHWNQAFKEGWEENKTLFSIEEACQKASFICYLLSDIEQIHFWPNLYPYLTKGKTLLFSSGFALAFSTKTHINPPEDIDVVLLAPKGPGVSTRQFFLEKKASYGSFAVQQNPSKMAREKALAYGFAIGITSLYETTFEKEAYSDLVSERGVLLGALEALLETQYEVLRENGHSPIEAYNETVEELTKCLIPLLANKGMEWLYRHCSATAQKGALDWSPQFKKALLPVFKELYKSVSSGKEAEVVITASKNKEYKQSLNQELKMLAEKEIWQADRLFFRSETVE